MIIVEGWVRLAPGEVERLRPAALEMLRATREEEGCMEYAFAIDLADPQVFRIVERWFDQDALNAHFASPHMAAFNKAMGEAKIEGGSVKSYDAAETRVLLGG